MSFLSSFNPLSWFSSQPTVQEPPVPHVEALDDDEFELINLPDVNEVQIPVQIADGSSGSKTIAGFTRAELIDMCNFSKISYGNSAEKLNSEGFKSIADYEAEGYTVIPFGNSYEQAGHIFLKGQNVVVAYHGTQSFNNILTDVHANLVTSHFLPEGGRLHCGFYRAFKDSWPTVANIINNHAKNLGLRLEDLHFDITGHSMGGAIAKILALCLHKTAHAQHIRVATFGDPRLLDLFASQIFNQSLGHHCVRVTQHGIDPVPAVCPGSLGYAHVGAQLRIPVDPAIKCHKLNGYFNVLKQIPEHEFLENNSVSLFYYPSKALQYANHFILGTIQHYYSKAYRGIFGHDNWSQKPFQELEASRDIPQLSAEPRIRVR